MARMQISVKSWVRIISLLMLVTGIALMFYGTYIESLGKFDAIRYRNKMDTVNRRLASKFSRTKLISRSDWLAISLHQFPKANDSKYPDSVSVELLPGDSIYLSKIGALNNKRFSDSDELMEALVKNVNHPSIRNYDPSHFLNVSDADDYLDSLIGIGVILFFSSLVALVVIGFIRNEEEKVNYNAMMEKIKGELQASPNKVMPAWDMAQLTLEQYFKRNLRQINMIFITSVCVMVAGFILIGFGVLKAVNDPAKISTSLLTSSCGILTEFIGATFIFIYNSTIKQAMNYTESLEKINSVGMSIKILDNIESNSADQMVKLNDAKIEIAKILLQPKPAAVNP
ncbi:MAG: hypothetical protein JSS79_13830 [Bacteroidetes bacterium]|nr:hypothetical protein [Bacteroidota bacterium]